MTSYPAGPALVLLGLAIAVIGLLVISIVLTLLLNLIRRLF